MISESHVCSQCKHKVSVPTDSKFKSWELCCKLKSKDVNPDGGLTDCCLFEEEL
ncbi:TPA_asm: hypothetical protein CBHJFHIM_00027 [Methanobrevibacter gottschalkii virus vir075]|uniref:hypothetical protein n=1 Tax=Methanobrevibacter gottschalkii TaxID=190974 RepID=UPI0015D66086|nr:hypothetical protein [Methanobrevibacter gottschalkii]